jgi:hypothetical protein
MNNGEMTVTGENRSIRIGTCTGATCLPQIPTWTDMGWSGEKSATTAQAMARPQKFQGDLKGMEFMSKDCEFA